MFQENKYQKYERFDQRENITEKPRVGKKDSIRKRERKRNG